MYWVSVNGESGILSINGSIRVVTVPKTPSPYHPPERAVVTAFTGGALLVTLLVMYLEVKAHLTSMATTAFCSDMPFHLV